MKTLILMSILILSGCGDQAESQATEIQKKMQEKANDHAHDEHDAHDDHAGHGHAHDEPCDHGHDHHHHQN